MSRLLRYAAPLAVMLLPTAASAHCFVGARFMPATLNVDDPCVADELSLPTVSMFKNGDDPSARQTDISAEFSKRITETFTDPSDCALAMKLFKDLEKDIVRGAILKTGQRIDGRDTKTVRQIVSEVGLLPRTAKFVRRYGELGESMRQAVKAYAEDVRGGAFPAPEHVYNLKIHT